MIAETGGSGKPFHAVWRKLGAAGWGSHIFVKSVGGKAANPLGSV
jgi:hypothetical protein